MCGIIGYTGAQAALPHRLQGLAALEYRGYDSAGVALSMPEEDILTVRACGKLRALEERLKTEGLDVLMEELRAIDPIALEKSQSNPRRILRALEVWQETGETITAHNLRTQAIPPKFTALWLGLDFADRAELYRRIDLRVDLMLEAGLLDEIRSLLASGISAKCTAMQAIGYKEFVAALEGRDTLENAAEELKKASRHYAKRQLTWFRRNKAIHWLTRQTGQGSEEILQQARQVLQPSDN